MYKDIDMILRFQCFRINALFERVKCSFGSVKRYGCARELQFCSFLFRSPRKTFNGT